MCYFSGQFGDTKFLGCIKEIQIAKESKLNLMKGDTSGVQEGCKTEVNTVNKLILVMY